MPRVEHAIVIHAPPERVFTMIAQNPERMPDWWTAFELQQRVTPPPTVVGSVSRYVYNMMGVKIKGEHRVTEMIENEYLLVKTISGIDSIFEFKFERVNSDAASPEMESFTRLTLMVEYALPGSVLGHLLNRLTLEQKNERDLQQALVTLKALIETQVTTQSP